MRPTSRNTIPRPTVAAKGHSVAEGGLLRIIRSLNDCIVHVVGTKRATMRIHPGSKSSGHQHPPIAAIAMLKVTPNGITESCAREIDAMTTPIEAQFDSVMNETLLLQSVADARLYHQVDGALFEHARAHALLDVFPAAIFDDDRFDAA